MQTVLLVIYLMVVLALIGVVLIQRSEGGGLGIGGGSGFMSARGTANALTRTTAILATLFFVRRDDLDDAFAIAGRLMDDDEDLIQKAVGGVLRECGKHDPARLVAFLDDNAATMPRTALRYAIEHLEPDARAHYRSLRATEEVRP